MSYPGRTVPVTARSATAGGQRAAREVGTVRAGLRRRTGSAAMIGLVAIAAAACGGSSNGIHTASALTQPPSASVPVTTTSSTPVAPATSSSAPVTPSASATTTTTAVTSSPMPTTTAATSSNATKALVTAQYTKFWRVADLDGSTNKTNDPELATVATANWVNRTADLILIHKQNGQRGYGISHVNVTSVAVAGATATVSDCHDFAGVGLMNSTGKKLNQGMSRQTVTGTLVQTKGTWKVSKLVTYAGASNC